MKKYFCDYAVSTRVDRETWDWLVKETEKIGVTVTVYVRELLTREWRLKSGEKDASGETYRVTRAKDTGEKARAL